MTAAFYRHQDLKEHIHVGRRSVLKSSAPRIDVGENCDAWDQQSYDALIGTHPWLARTTINTHITAKSEDGYAVGFFHVTPQNIPASATGPDRINVVSIPIIISDFKLYPFDIFLHKDQFYPLNEERIMRLMRLPDLYIETDRSPHSLEQNVREGMHPKGLQDFDWTTASNSLPGVKFSSAVSDLDQLRNLTADALVAALPSVTARMRRHAEEFLTSDNVAHLQKQSEGRLALQAALSHVTKGGTVVKASSSSSSEDDLDAVISSMLENEASLSLIEFKKTSADIQARDWWLSDPTSGKVSRSKWSSVPYHKVSQALGQDMTQQLLSDGYVALHTKESHGVTGSFPAVAQQLAQSEAFEQLEEMHEPGYFYPWKAKHSSLKTGPVPAYKLRFLNPKKKLGMPELFDGYIVNSAHGEAGFASGRQAILSMDGCLCIPSDQWSDLEDIKVLWLGDSSTDNIPAIKKVRKYVSARMASSMDFQPSEFAMWKQDGALLGLLVSSNTTSIDGELFYKTIDPETGCARMMDNDRSIYAHFSQDFARMVTEPRKDRVILHVPSQASRTSVFGDKQQDEDKLFQETALEPIEESAPLAKESAALYSNRWAGEIKNPATLTVQSMGDGYAISHPLLSGIPGSQEKMLTKQASACLRFCGLSDMQANEVLEQVKISHSVSFTVDTPAHSMGSDIASSAREKANRVKQLLNKVSSAIPVNEMPSVIEVAYSHLRPHIEREKVSSLILGMSVDAALSLNFLNPETLIKFADMRPDLEESLSKLCALLMASRLGMTEVPESALTMCIHGLEPTLQGLRLLETSLQDM